MCVGVRSSCSTILVGAGCLDVEGASSNKVTGGTTPHFSQQATALSIQASSNISRDHSRRKQRKRFRICFKMPYFLLCVRRNTFDFKGNLCTSVLKALKIMILSMPPPPPPPHTHEVRTPGWACFRVQLLTHQKFHDHFP